MLPFFGKEIKGPAQACQSSKQTEPWGRGGGGTIIAAEAEVLIPEWEEEDEEEIAEYGVSSSSVVLRSINPMWKSFFF